MIVKTGVFDSKKSLLKFEADFIHFHFFSAVFHFVKFGYLLVIYIVNLGVEFWFICVVADFGKLV